MLKFLRFKIYEKRTPSTLLKNSNYLMKPSKPTSGQLARLPNGSPVRPAFPVRASHHFTASFLINPFSYRTSQNRLR